MKIGQIIALLFADRRFQRGARRFLTVAVILPVSTLLIVKNSSPVIGSFAVFISAIVMLVLLRRYNKMLDVQRGEILKRENEQRRREGKPLKRPAGRFSWLNPFSS